MTANVGGADGQMRVTNDGTGSDADRRLVSLRAVFPTVTSLLP